MTKEQADLRRRFREAGFEITEGGGEPGSFNVKKDRCTLSLRRAAGDVWQPDGPPTLSVAGLDCRLEDQGHQKFWLHGDERFPIRVSELRTMHRFDQEVRAILGRKSLYHESLGTTSARTAYDRLTGRPDGL